MIAVHVTHEAVEKMGGIGAVIAGLVTARNYQHEIERTVLMGPLLATDRPAAERLGPGGRIIYSSLDDIDTGNWAARFKPIEQTYQVGIIYGVRKLTDGPLLKPVDVEVLLVDVFRANRNRLNLFKAELWTKFGVPSDDFEKIWEFEQYVRLAEPAYEAMHVIGCRGTPGDPVIIMAHEYMGMPTALKAIMDGRPDVRTIFYAHEVASVRRIVEKHPGHELMFYNLLAQGQANGRCLEDYFPTIRDYYKHPLVKAARQCDAIFAVGDMVGKEMQFLDPACSSMPVDMVFNGVPAHQQSLAQRHERRAKMKQYGHNLLGFQPDYTFAHVARPVLSKGIWRDLRVLHELEPLLAAEGKTAVYFLLGTLAGQRSTRDVLHMEKLYGWPLHHKHNYPDLCNGEETLDELFEDFNKHHESTRVVLVNQFGWERRLCGLRMPEGSSFADIRCGTDAEFGLSVYEPFGISQLEPLAFGAICLVSNVCGCYSFAERCAKGKLPPNILAADFTQMPPDKRGMDPLAVGMAERDAVENFECHRLAQELYRRLPKNDADIAKLLESGWKLGNKLDWEQVVAQCFLPAIREIASVQELETGAA